MATQTVQFTAAAGQTGTCKLFAPGSDVQVASVAITEATNRKGTYTAAFTDVAAGTFQVLILSTGGTKLADWWVELLLATGTYFAKDDFLDTEIAAIKVVTDKLNTGLVVDGAVWQWTVNALELAPVGAGGGGSGGTISEAVVVARVPVGGTEGWPKEFVIGDARLTSLATAPKLFVKDIDDIILKSLGTKNFADADFHATLRFAPLTDTTRDLNGPPATIEVTEADSPGIVFNSATLGAEYFELQIPKAKADLGVIKTEYNCQFIMNWGATTVYESSINLGTIKFIRKNSAVV